MKKLLASLAILFCLSLVLSPLTLMSQGTSTLVRHGTVLPTTCSATKGETYFLTSGAAGLYSCTATNTWTLPTGSQPGYYYASSYGVTGTGFWVCDASFTNTSQIVTINNDSVLADPSFITAGVQVGWIVFGTSDHCAAPFVSGPKVPLGTVTSVDSATQIHVSIAATSTCTSSSLNAVCKLFVAPADLTTQLQAAFNTVTASGQCATLILPAGVIPVSLPVFNTGTGCAQDNTSNGYGPGVTIEGRGMESTFIVPLPNFDAATCPATGCFFGMSTSTTGQTVNFKDFQINGIGNNTVTNSSGKAAIDLGPSSTSFRVGVNAWGIDVGMTFNGNNAVQAVCYSCEVLNAGKSYEVQFGGTATPDFGVVNVCIGCNFSWQPNSFGHMAFITAPTLTSGTTFAYGPSSGANQPYVDVSVNGVWTSNDDTILQSNSNGTWFVQCDGTCKINDGNIRYGAGFTSINGIRVTSGGHVYLKGTKIDVDSGTGATSVNVLSGGWFTSLGGNNIAGLIPFANAGKASVDPTDTISDVSGLAPSCVFTSGGGTSPSCAMQAGSTNDKGVIIASTGTGSPGTTGTITLTFNGTSYPGPTSAAPVCDFRVDNSGTAWANESGTQVNTQSTTAPVFAWYNLASGTLTALTTSSPYRISYSCTGR